MEQFSGKAKVAILEGIPGHETGDSRLRGFHVAISQEPGIEILALQSANWERDQGFSVCQNLLQAHPDIEAIFCSKSNDLNRQDAKRAKERMNVLALVRCALCSSC